LCATLGKVYIVFPDASILVRRDRSLRRLTLTLGLVQTQAQRPKKIVAWVERFVSDTKAEGDTVEKR
jgi:hypothetical protein